MTTLSLCMIVKNEEKYLSQCLISAAGVADEIIIVDTGSTDRTLDIAAGFGARVFHHPWENHFSKHRNQSIGYAQGDWILWLDADEALEPGATPVLKDALRNPDLDSLLVTMVCYFENRTRTSWNNSIKLFKNGLGIHFEGAIHEQVVGFKNTGFCPVKIYHYGYDQDPKTVQKKFERTSALLLQAIQDDPHSFRHHHDLAVSFSSIHRFSKAIDAGFKAMELYRINRENDPNILWTYFVVASACFNLGQIDKAQFFAEQALRLEPNHLDSYFVLASVYATLKNRECFEEAFRAFTRLALHYRAHPEQLAGLVMNKLDEKWRLDLEYGALLLSGNLKTEAVPIFTQASQQAPDPSRAYRIAAQLCRDLGEIRLGEDFLKNASQAGLPLTTARFEEALLKRASGDEQAFHAALAGLIDGAPGNMDPDIATALGIEALKSGKYIRAEFLLQTALAQGYETPSLCTHLALASKYQGKISEAMSWNQKALELDQKDLNALVNLGHLLYDQKQWHSAQSQYQKALLLAPRQADVLLRLSLIALMDQDLAECIRFCDLLLSALNLNCDRVVTSIQDIAEVYRLIGDALRIRGQNILASEAATLSAHLSGT